MMQGQEAIPLPKLLSVNDLHETISFKDNQGLIQIGDQVGGFLDSGGVAHQPFRNSHAGSLIGGALHVAGGGRRPDDGFHCVKVGGTMGEAQTRKQSAHGKVFSLRMRLSQTRASDDRQCRIPDVRPGRDKKNGFHRRVRFYRTTLIF